MPIGPSGGYTGNRPLNPETEPPKTRGSACPPSVVVNTEGAQELSQWFSLSYSSFLTLPRVLMEAMPDEWQGKMAALLNDYDNTFPNRPEGMGSRVQITQDGKLTKTPKWMLNYRHPDRQAINALRG